MHGIDLDLEEKHTLLYCKTLAAQCSAVVCLCDDSKLEAGGCCVIANHLASIPANRGRNVK